MVKVAAESTVKLWDTGVAADRRRYRLVKPEWYRFPPAIKFAVVPETVHTAVVSEVKLTGKPELAVGSQLMTRSLGLRGIGSNVIVWVPSTVKLRETGVAAA